METCPRRRLQTAREPVAVRKFCRQWRAIVVPCCWIVDSCCTRRLLSHQPRSLVCRFIVRFFSNFLRQWLCFKLVVSKTRGRQLDSLHYSHLFLVSRSFLRSGYIVELCCHFQKFLDCAPLWHCLCYRSHFAARVSSSLYSWWHSRQKLRQSTQRSLSHKQNSQADSRPPLVSPLVRADYYGWFPSFQRNLHRNFRTFCSGLGIQSILHTLWNFEHCLYHLADCHVVHYNSSNLFSTCCGRSQVVVARSGRRWINGLLHHGQMFPFLEPKQNVRYIASFFFLRLHGRPLLRSCTDAWSYRVFILNGFCSIHLWQCQDRLVS